MHYWENLHLLSESYCIQLLRSQTNLRNFMLTRVFEIEVNEQLQVKMVRLYLIDEVIILLVMHNDILHL